MAPATGKEPTNCAHRSGAAGTRPSHGRWRPIDALQSSRLPTSEAARLSDPRARQPPGMRVRKAHVPAHLRRRVTAQALHRCGYCLTPEVLTGAAMEVE